MIIKINIIGDILKLFNRTIVAFSVLSVIATVQADVPKKSDVLLRQFDTGNYSEASVSLPEYFKADWYNWIFHHWRPITQSDKTDFYQEIAQTRALGIKVQARVEFDANWKTFAEYFAMEGIEHQHHAVRSLEGKIQLYPAHLGLPAGKNCSGQNCASSRFTEQELAQGSYQGQTWDFAYAGQEYVIPPYFYSTHSPATIALLKKQVDVLMGGSPEQTIGFQLGGNVDAIMFDSQTSSSKTLYWGGDFSGPSLTAFNLYLSTKYSSLADFNELLNSHIGDYQVNGLNEFDYAEFLRVLGYNDESIANAVYLNQTTSIPLYDLFKQFHVNAHGELLQLLKEHANNFKDANGQSVPNIDISSSGKLVYPIAGHSPDSSDFYSQEEQGDAQNIKLLYKVAEAQGKSLTFNQGPPDWIKMAEQKAVNRPRTLMAQAYANGVNYVVPVKNDQYLSNPGDFEFITDFISGNEALFDNYSSVSNIHVLHSYEAMEAAKSHRINGEMPALFLVDSLLEQANIQYNLLSFGSDIWEEEPTARELAQAKVIVTTSDINQLTESQQQLLKRYQQRIVHIESEADMDQLYEKIGQHGYVHAGEHNNDVEVVVRKSNDRRAPFVLHALNKTLNSDSDELTKLSDVTIQIRYRDLLRTPINKAVYYSVDDDPNTVQCIELPLNEIESGVKEFTLPVLDSWGVVVLEAYRGDEVNCTVYEETVIAPLPPQDVDENIDDSLNMISNGYFTNGTSDWRKVGAQLELVHTREIGSYLGDEETWVGRVFQRGAKGSSVRAQVKFSEGHEYQASVLTKFNGDINELKLAIRYPLADNDSKFVYPELTVESLDNGWSRLSTSFKLPEEIGSEGYQELYLLTANSTEDIYFDKFTLVDTTPVSYISDSESYENDFEDDFWTGFHLNGASLDVMRLPLSDHLGRDTQDGKANYDNVNDWLSANAAQGWRYSTVEEMKAIAQFYQQDSAGFHELNGSKWSPAGDFWNANIPTSAQTDGDLMPAFSFKVTTTNIGVIEYKPRYNVSAKGAAALIVRNTPTGDTGEPPTDEPIVLYVSFEPTGDPDGSVDAPYNGLLDAQQAVRSLIAQGKNTLGITVELQSGDYFIAEGLSFSDADSGTETAPVVYKAADGAQVNFFGGVLLDPSAFSVADSTFTSQLVDGDLANQILEIDLAQAGLENLSQSLGEVAPHGWNMEPSNRVPAAMLYSGNEKMDLARWPNVDEQSVYLDEGSTIDDITGMVSYTSVINKGLTQQDANKFSDEFNNGGGTIAVEFDRPSFWNKLNEVHLDGILAYSWEWTYNQVKAFDAETKQLTLKRGELSGIGSNKANHFYFENIAEELDQAGEFYIDRDLGKLYFYPTDNFASNTTVLSTLAEPMVSISGAKYLSFDGITFDTGRNLAVKVTQGQHIEITNCTIRNFSLGGVLLDGANNSISGCEIANVGGYGVKLAGGTAAKLSKSSSSQVLDTLQQPVDIVAANNLVTENTIHNFAWDQKSQVPGVSLTGVGNSATYNEIHTAPHFGILMRNTTDNVVAYNYVHDLPNYHKNDGGALYVGIGSSPQLRGNEITNNYFEFIPTNGVYLDNFSSGIKVEHNVFNEVGNNNDTFSGININGGGQNLMQQNFFYNASRPVKYNKFAANSLFNNYYNKMLGVQTAFNDADVNTTPYVKYPDFIEFLAFSSEDEFHYQSSTAVENFSFNNLVVTDVRADVTGVVEPTDKRWVVENNALVEELSSELQTEYDVIAPIFNIRNDKDNWRSTVENVTNQLSISIPLMLSQVELPPEPVAISSYSNVDTWQNDSSNNFWSALNIANAGLDIMRLPASDDLGAIGANNDQVQAWLAGEENIVNEQGYQWRYATEAEMQAIGTFYENNGSAFLELNGQWSPLTTADVWTALIPTAQQGNCTHNDGCAYPSFGFTAKPTQVGNVAYKQSFNVSSKGGAALIVRDHPNEDVTDPIADNLIINGDFEAGTIEPWNIAQGGASMNLETAEGNTIAVIKNRESSHASTVKQSFIGLVADQAYSLDANIQVIETGYEVGVFIGYRNEGATKDIALQVGSYLTTNGNWQEISAEFTLPADALADKGFRIWVRSTKGEHATTDLVPSIYIDDVVLLSQSNGSTDPDPVDPEPTQQSLISDEESFLDDSSEPFWTAFNINDNSLDIMRLPSSDDLGGHINISTDDTTTWLESAANAEGWRWATKVEMETIVAFYEGNAIAFLEMNGNIWSPKTTRDEWNAIIPGEILDDEDGAGVSWAVNILANAIGNVTHKHNFNTNAKGGAPLLVRASQKSPTPDTINIAVNGDLESGVDGYVLQKALFEVIFDAERNSNVGHVYNRSVVSSSARLDIDLEAGKQYSISVDANLVDTNLTSVIGDLDLILLYFVDGQRSSIELATEETSEGWITLSGEIAFPIDAEITGGKVWVKSDTLNDILFDNLVVETEVIDTTGPDPDPEPEAGVADGEAEGYGIAASQCQADLSMLKADALYVSAGSEAGNGSEGSPFNSLTSALSSVAVNGVINQPGLTIYLREGQYNESIDSSIVTSLTGSTDNPIVIEAYPCEKPTFIGTTNIENLASTDEFGDKSQWQQHYGNIYKREITAPVWQLFVDNEQRMIARWPNANFELPSTTNHQSIYSDDVWAEGKLDSAKTKNGIMTNDPAYHDLANAKDYRGEPLNVNGAVVLANTASFYTYSRLVKPYDEMSSSFTSLFKTLPDDISVGHIAGSNIFTHEPIKSGYKGKQLSYYLEAKLELLDATNEWHYQVEEGKHYVYLWSDTYSEPTGEVTVRDTGYALNITNWENVEINGLGYFATTVKCSPCNNITIADSTFKHSATSQRILKQYGDDKSGYGRNQLIELYSSVDKRANSGIVFKNNVVTDSDVQSLIIQGGQSIIENNLFERLDATSADTISPHATVMITKMTNQKATFSRNTMDIIGNSTMFVPEGGSLHALYNDMITGGFAQNDGASFQLRKAQQAAANIAYNWAHDSEKYGIRFDAPFDTTDETSGGQFGLIHHNVVWNAKGIMVKGDDHRVYHNTTWNNADIDQRMLVDPNPYYRHERTVTSNNASDSISSDRLAESDSLAGVVGNNFNGLKETVSLVSQLTDMFNYDFRPLRIGALHDGGAVIDSPNNYAAYTGDAPLPQYQEATAQGESLDLGAYELDSSFYWIPGYKMAKASFAIPRNELVDAMAKPVSADVSLMWRDGYQAISHNVYLAGTKNEIESVAIGETDTALYKGNFVAEQANIYQSSSELASGGYYWRVDAVQGDGSVVKGDTWKFIVE